MELRDREMQWNGNEIVFADNPRVGVAGIAPGMPDALAVEIVRRWNLHLPQPHGSRADKHVPATPHRTQRLGGPARAARGMQREEAQNAESAPMRTVPRDNSGRYNVSAKRQR